MDALVEESRARGYARSTVCTDSLLAWDFYERYGFEPSPTHPLHLVLLMKDIRKTLGI